jgi:2-amino-4-hydroxy-6-hydroxymethyldihydropteridine diphosphokinase
VVRAFIGLGSNVGDRLARLRGAVRALREFPSTRVAALSPVYETSPVGPRQRDFLNMAVDVRTSLDPDALLARLKETEAELGRRSRRKWGPREIDLDLIFYGGRVVRRKTLRVPHPRLAERKFVLLPLSRLAPRFKDPVTGATVAALLRRLTAPDQRIKVFKKAP